MAKTFVEWVTIAGGLVLWCENNATGSRVPLNFRPGGELDMKHSLSV